MGVLRALFHYDPDTDAAPADEPQPTDLSSEGDPQGTAASDPHPAVGKGSVMERAGSHIALLG